MFLVLCTKLFKILVNMVIDNFNLCMLIVSGGNIKYDCLIPSLLYASSLVGDMHRENDGDSG